MSDTESKTDPASEQKLRKKRSEGSIASSQDSSGLFGAALGISIIASTGIAMWQKIATAIVLLPDVLLLPASEAIDVATKTVSDLLLWTVVPVILVTISVSVVSILILNRGILFAMKSVTPNLERVSFSKGVKRVFGKRGLMESLIGFIRLFLWLFFSSMVSLIWLPWLIRSTFCGISCQVSVLQPHFWFLAIGLISLMLMYAFVDIPIQRNLFLGEQKMTKSELKKERKDQFGSPQIRQERNRVRNEARSSTGKPALSRANFLFFHGSKAIAVRYMPPDTTIPRIMAKARTMEETQELTKKLFNTGVHFIENERITNGGIGEGLGESIDVNCFEEFSNAVNKLLDGLDK